uniref:CCHC-type domain-containing protein n=2 Tax=Trichogramma kaykai TaxID=54128 RepID=A0ABD2X888_9HYME
MSTEDNTLPQQRGSDLQLPVAESVTSGGSSLSPSSSYPVIPRIIVPAEPAVPNSVAESITSFSRRNSMSSVASSVSDTGSESKKRKVIEDDHEMETESDLAKANPCLATRLEDLEDETHAGLDRIRTRHKFSSVLTDYVKQQFHIAKRIALELAFENARLAAKNAYLSDLVDRRLAPSYSSVVAQGAAAKGSSSRPQKGSLIPDPNSKTKPVSPSPSAGRKKKKSAKKSFVAVVSLDKKDEPRADSEVLMSVLKSTIDPVGDGIHVRSVNKSRSGRLFVETASKQDLDKLISNDALKAKGVSVTLKERRLPRMIIYDVPVVHSDLELVQLLRRQNSILTPEHVLKPIFKVGKRDNEVTHWVMEVSPECRDVLVKEGGLYLGWRRCRVKEHCALTRCYKCQDFSHIAKHCKEKDSTCGKCGEVGHTFKECTTEKQAKVCVPCRRAMRPHDHFPDLKCPLYIAKLRKLAASVEGGNSNP